MASYVDCSISACGKSDRQPIAHYLGEFFFGVPVASVFGFREHAKLHGGRQFFGPEISEHNIGWMYDHGIG